MGNLKLLQSFYETRNPWTWRQLFKEELLGFLPENYSSFSCYFSLCQNIISYSSLVTVIHLPAAFSFLRHMTNLQMIKWVGGEGGCSVEELEKPPLISHKTQTLTVFKKQFVIHAWLMPDSPWVHQQLLHNPKQCPKALAFLLTCRYKAKYLVPWTGGEETPGHVAACTSRSQLTSSALPWSRLYPQTPAPLSPSPRRKAMLPLQRVPKTEPELTVGPLWGGITSFSGLGVCGVRTSREGVLSLDHFSFHYAGRRLYCVHRPVVLASTCNPLCLLHPAHLSNAWPGRSYSLSNVLPQPGSKGTETWLGNHLKNA